MLDHVTQLDHAQHVAAFGDDPVLDGLERKIDISNQNLKAAAAALRCSPA